MLTPRPTFKPLSCTRTTLHHYQKCITSRSRPHSPMSQPASPYLLLYNLHQIHSPCNNGVTEVSSTPSLSQKYRITDKLPGHRFGKPVCKVLHPANTVLLRTNQLASFILISSSHSDVHLLGRSESGNSIHLVCTPRVPCGGPTVLLAMLMRWYLPT